jgi:hypothetical protein
MDAAEIVEKAKGLCPAADLSATDAKLRDDVLAPFKVMSKQELLDVIFELIRRRNVSVVLRPRF